MYENTCPDKTDFQLYLNGELNELKTIAFDKHMENCELCKVAISGFKGQYLSAANTANPQSKTKAHYHLYKRLLPYAAAIAIVFALALNLFIKMPTNKNILTEQADVSGNSEKTLMHKSNSDYWFVGAQNQIAYNDQLIDASALEDALNKRTNTHQVYIQVDDADKASVDFILEKIKSQLSVPVFTYSKHKGLKRN